MASSLKSVGPRLARLAHALSDETRIELVQLLRRGERCVCDLMTDTGAAQSRLSFHLRVLKEAGLVKDRKEGRWSFYRLDTEAVELLHDLVIGLRPRGLPVVATRRREASGSCCG